MVKSNTTRRDAKLTKPAALKAGHILSSFECGRPEITRWLKERALDASKGGTAVTYVVCRGGKRVVAYYALAAGALAHELAPRALKRNTPDPIPVFLLARLGVDLTEQRKGLGGQLMSDAMRRALQGAKIIGARALLVHALDDSLAEYYRSLGFLSLGEQKQTLYIAMSTIRDAL
jgi:GNAT superfamily N-acetyltransferase